MKKTLGGDRLGSGKKMKVDLHGYERSTHDMGYLWRSTMSIGTLVPFLSEVALPGDTFDIDLNCDIKTLPTEGPLFGSAKVQLDVFQAPIRLYNAMLHNNMLGIGLDMSRVLLPQLDITVAPTTNMPSDIDNSQINPSALLSYLNIRGIGIQETETTQTRQFNAISYLAYWEIYKNYYANKQEQYGAYIHQSTPIFNKTVDLIKIDGNDLPEYPSSGYVSGINPDSTITIDFTGAAPDPKFILINTRTSGFIPISDIFSNFLTVGTTITGSLPLKQLIAVNWRYRNSTDPYISNPQVTPFLLASIDDMRMKILAHTPTTAFTISNSQNANPPYGPPLDFTEDFGTSLLSSQEGLGLKTYQSDLFNNWLLTEWIDGTNGINQITAIDTSDGSFTLDTLNLSKKVYDMLNRIAVSGGSYDDWLDAVYAHDRYTRCESPMYMGGLSKELVFQEVVSNSASPEVNSRGSQPLGTLAGRGRMAEKHKGGKVVIKVDEPSYIIGIISITPRIDYSQGNKWDVHLKTMNDLHKPALDEIGFQELITEQMAWWSTKWDDVNSEWVTKSAGKQPAWINYMTNVNQTRGNFAIPDNQMFMTFNRRYEADTNYDIDDLTTYIDPSKMNFIFADASIDAQNYWVQVAVDMIARRKMSAKVMPNL